MPDSSPSRRARRPSLPHLFVIAALFGGCSTGAVDMGGATGASTANGSSTSGGNTTGAVSTTATSTTVAQGAQSSDPAATAGGAAAVPTPYTAIGIDFDPNGLRYAYYYEQAGGATTGPSVNVSNCNVNIVVSSDPNACDSGQYVVRDANIPVLSIAFSQNSNTTDMQPANCSPPNWPAATPWASPFFFYGQAVSVQDSNTAGTPVPAAQYAGAGNVSLDIATPLNSAPAPLTYSGNLSQSPNQGHVYLNATGATHIDYSVTAKPCRFPSTMFQ